MLIARPEDRKLIIKILSQAFDDNQSVNYIIKQDKKRQNRIEMLMDYSFKTCQMFGKVYLSDDKKACALILFPDQKRTTIRSVLLDLNLIISSIGFGGLKKTLNRENQIKRIQPKEKMYYLWFIGVGKPYQNSGVGSSLLKEVIHECSLKNLPLYLETSTLKNLPWYEKFGFKIYAKLELSYTLFFLKKSQ